MSLTSASRALLPATYFAADGELPELAFAAATARRPLVLEMLVDAVEPGPGRGVAAPDGRMVGASWNIE